ncbi:transcriptional antiterminator [Lacticaseibacillus paracasei]|nr:transcriptional antiterminator [Lacticaseibacillus paracasei]
MEELLESNLLRHFRIVRFLLGREWVTIGELAHTLRIPSRTIRQSIGEINQYINPAKIESSQKFGIRLTYDAQLNSFYIYASIYKQSAHFLIMANYKFNPNKPGIFQWQSVDDVFLMVVD